MRAVTLAAEDDFEGWRDAARALAGARVPPSEIVWQTGEADLFAQAEPLPPPKPIRVPRPFLELAETVVLHNDPQRFALLYTLLTALLEHPERIADAADPLGGRLQAMAKSVRRDILLSIGRTTTVDLQLEVGGVEETVTVTTQAPLVDATSPEIGGNVTREDITDMPSVMEEAMWRTPSTPETPSSMTLVICDSSSEGAAPN